VHPTQLETHEVIDGNGICRNDGVELQYDSGTISIFPAASEHSVRAGSDGLLLFAKFMPALC
jgi:mannose-6-phosphate isomerase-like protein (cupin superfamily)